MSFKIVNFHYWDRPNWGYYSYMDDFSWQHIKMKCLAIPSFAQYFMDNVSVIVFSDFVDQWWIGAEYDNDRKHFKLMGPYSDYEEAVTIMVLYTDKQEMF